MHRFYIPHERWNSEPLTLTGQEARHCAEVLRHREGDKVTVFNGRGGEATSTIASIGRDEVVLTTVGKANVPPLPAKITIGQAIPKGKNMDLIVQKATELGAHAILPVLSERTVVRLDDGDRESKREKWRQVTVEAAKQCGRAWLPDVMEPKPLREALEAAGSSHDLSIIASLQPDSRSFSQLLGEYRETNGSLPKSVLILIGPEGDFTPAEMSLARSLGCRPVSLGPIVLRAETAALYALSVLGNALFA